jgi:proline iminopeptidase
MNRPAPIPILIGFGQPVIIIPGGPGFGFQYLLPLGELLRDELQLVFFEPVGPLMADYVQEVESLRQALGDESVTLLGHSFGGLVALHYVLAHPGRVRRLVLLEPDPLTHAEWVSFRALVASRQDPEIRIRMERIAASADWQRTPAAVEGYFRLALRPYFHDPVLAESLEFGFDSGSFDRLQKMTREARVDLGEWDMSERIFQTPTLLIHGDASIFSAGAVDTARVAFPVGQSHVLAGVGHFPHIEAPDETGRLILGWKDSGRQDGEGPQPS